MYGLTWRRGCDEVELDVPGVHIALAVHADDGHVQCPLSQHSRVRRVLIATCRKQIATPSLALASLAVYIASGQTIVLVLPDPFLMRSLNGLQCPHARGKGQTGCYGSEKGLANDFSMLTTFSYNNGKL